MEQFDELVSVCVKQLLNMTIHSKQRFLGSQSTKGHWIEPAEPFL